MAQPQRDNIWRDTDDAWDRRAHIDIGHRLRITVEFSGTRSAAPSEPSARPSLLRAVYGLLIAVVAPKRVPRETGSPVPQSGDAIFHGDGYSVRRLSREESRRAGLLGYNPQTVGPISYSTEEFLASLAARSASDDPAPVAPDADLR